MNPIDPAQRIDLDASSYSDYRQKHEYDHDLGLVVLPLASRTPGYRVIRLHGGVAKRTVRWAASRAGRPPMIPAAGDTNGDTLLSTSVSPRLPTPNKDQIGYDWTISGEYAYVQKTPRVAGENALPTGSFPFPVSPQVLVAADNIGATVTSLYSNTPTTDKTDELSARAVAQASLVNGALQWPYTFAPAELTSTTIIGG